MEPSLFDDVADALRGLMPPELGRLRCRSRSFGIKVWFDSETPPEPRRGGRRAFLGRDGWRRVSETWPDPDLDSAELAFELAARLTDYVIAIEPVPRTR